MFEVSVFAVCLVAISPAIGSFLNVLIDRLPRGEDVLTRPSACRTCGTRLGLRDLIPVLSFAANRGRCRSCKTEIPAWHLYVEITAVGVAVLSVVAGGPDTIIALTALFWWALLALAVTDLIWLRLPDVLTAALLVIGLLFGMLDPSRAISDVLLAAIVASGSFLLIRWAYFRIRHREGLGLGDVKLMAGIGAWAGIGGLPVIVLLASILALVAALANAFRSQASLSSRLPLPFGAALAASTFLIWIFRPIIF